MVALNARLDSMRRMKIALHVNYVRKGNIRTNKKRIIVSNARKVSTRKTKATFDARHVQLGLLEQAAESVLLACFAVQMMAWSHVANAILDSIKTKKSKLHAFLA